MEIKNEDLEKVSGGATEIVRRIESSKVKMVGKERNFEI